MTAGQTAIRVTDPALPVAVAVNLPELRERFTSAGRQWFREVIVSVAIETPVRKAWATDKAEFLRRGWGWRRFDGSWFLQQWLRKDADGWTLTEVGAAIVARLENPKPVEEATTKPAFTLAALPAEYEAKLFDYQVEPARQLFRALTCGDEEWGYPGAVDCSDLGTGKTYQALAAALATGLRVGVVCPLAVIPAWQAAFIHFGARPLFVANYESLRTGNRTNIVRRNPGGKWADVFDWTATEGVCLIFDEAHNCKNHLTLNAKLLAGAMRQRIPLLCLSGTLATDPTQLRVVGRALGLHRGGSSYELFLAQHGCKEDRFDKWYLVRGDYGKSGLVRINKTLFPARGSRTRIADLGDRFPETQILVETIETGETRKIREAFLAARDIIRKLEAQGATEAEIRFQSGSAYMKAWHESERIKVPSIVRMVKDEQENGRSVAVFCNFIDTREALTEALKTDCAIFGGQRADRRQQCIEDFQADRSRVIVANIDAGGVGVSLHDLNGNHPRTSIILPTNKVVSITQALGRVHRAGGKSKSRQIIYFAAGTIEAEICKTTRAKMANLAALNDGDLNPILPDFDE